jgi:hypothetical protein
MQKKKNKMPAFHFSGSAHLFQNICALLARFARNKWKNHLCETFVNK